MIKKIWNDPVGSKVISVGVIAFITLIYTKFLSFSNQLTFSQAFNKVLEIKISLLYVIVGLLIFSILKMILKRVTSQGGDLYNQKQKKLMTFNRKMSSEEGLLLKWSVFFDYDTPFIADLTGFCLRHGSVPLRLINDSCPVSDCENSRRTMNRNSLKNSIESELIDKWDKIK